MSFAIKNKVCAHCVMDETAPITFDEKGICNYCREYAVKERQRRFEKTELPWRLHQIKKDGQGKKYDVILGLSGGVDSSLCLHYLIQQGLRPLCFSVDNGWNTPESDENIMRLVEGLRIPFYRRTINLERFRALQEAFIKSGVPNIEVCTDHILMATTYEVAVENGIKWIISGGNLATEGIMPEAWGYNARDLTHIKAIYRKFTGKKLTGLPLISLPQYLYYRFVKGIKIMNLLDCYEYNREEAKKLLAGRYGWKDYGEKHEESIFTKWFQGYYLPVIHKIDKRKAHYSSLICSGQMKREEALRLLAQPPTFPAIEWQNLPIMTLLKAHRHEDYPMNKWWGRLSRIYQLCK